MEKLKFIIVGSGWRAGFYAKAAARYPEELELLGVLCRSREKAERVSREWGVYATDSPEELIGRKPELVVVAVSRGMNFKVVHRWLQMGFPVLAETPAGESMEELEHLWELKLLGAKLQVAEQYFRYPIISAGLSALNSGLIGGVDSVYLSLVHDYHAASLIRRVLGLDVGGRLPEFKVEAKKSPCRVELTDSRSGPLREGTVALSDRITAYFTFDNGRTALYDFDGVQYHSFIRSRHLCARGERGEWSDTVIRYSDPSHTVRELKLTAGGVPGFSDMVTRELEALGRSWSPHLRLEQCQDEYAVATLLRSMGDYIRSGREFYPLREALEDAYMWLKLAEAIDTGLPALSGDRAWNR